MDHPQPTPAVGGQAVIGGVMMRNGERWCVAVRATDGTIATRGGTVTTGRWAKAPGLRGVLGVWSGLRLGTKVLLWSGRQQLDDADDAPRWLLAVAATVPVLVFGLAFMAAPAALAGAVGGPRPVTLVLEGVLRAAMVVGYVWGVGRMAHVADVFAYHGAEHKAVNCYEAGDTLDATHAVHHPTVHQRCGTSFIVVVIVVAQLVFALAPHDGWPRAVSRLVGLPLVAAASYEVLALLARNQHRRWARTAARPGLWLQSLTTREPRPDQVEVAVAALRGCTDEVAATAAHGAAATR